MRTKSILITIAFFCLSMTAFAHIYDTNVKWEITNDGNGGKNVSVFVSGPSSVNYWNTQAKNWSYASGQMARVGSYSVYVKNGEETTNIYNFASNISGFSSTTENIAIPEGTVYLDVKLDAPNVPEIYLTLNLENNTLNVYHRGNNDWHSVYIQDYKLSQNGVSSATIKVDSTPVGGPLPAPVVTLLIALAFGGAFVLYRNRKQAKA